MHSLQTWPPDKSRYLRTASFQSSAPLIDASIAYYTWLKIKLDRSVQEFGWRRYCYMPCILCECRISSALLLVRRGSSRAGEEFTPKYPDFRTVIYEFSAPRYREIFPLVMGRINIAMSISTYKICNLVRIHMPISAVLTMQKEALTGIIAIFMLSRSISHMVDELTLYKSQLLSAYQSSIVYTSLSTFIAINGYALSIFPPSIGCAA